MKRFITILVIVTIATPALAQSPTMWRLLGGDPAKGIRAYIDTGAIRRVGKSRVVTLLIQTPQGDGISHMEIDCQHQLIRDYPDDQPWRRIQPRTLGDAAFRYVCQ